MDNFKNVKPSDRVWDFRKGWGTVVGNLIDYEYPIEVSFDNESNDTYTLEGKSFRLDMNPTLFWDEVKFVIPQKPIKMKLVHGVEVPDISFQPKLNENYYYPNPDNPSLKSNTFYSWGSSDDNHRAKHGLCYPYTVEGKEAAILHAKAMLGISP